jgi:hypothetical protein
MSMQTESSPSTGPTSSDTETSEPLTGQPLSQLTLFAEAFPVSRIRPLVDDWQAPTSGTCGVSSSEQFAVLDRGGSWRKTSRDSSQVNLDGSLDEFCETWPRAGMTRNGIVFQRSPSVPLTVGTEFGSWPTPRNCTAMAAAFTENTVLAKFPNLETVVARRELWKSPAAADTRDRGNMSNPAIQRRALLGKQIMLSMQAGGALNPPWVEWLMGYPLGWTALEDSAMPLSRRSRNGSRTGSKKRKG